MTGPASPLLPMGSPRAPKLPCAVVARKPGASGEFISTQRTHLSSAENRESRERILWIEDERALMAPLASFLDKEGLDVEFAETGESGLRLAPSCTYALILLDLRLPDIHGIEVLQRLRAAGVNTPVIVITGYGSIASAVEAIRSGAADYRCKPVRAADLLQTIRSVLAPRETKGSPTALFREPQGQGPSLLVTEVMSHFLEAVAAMDRPEPDGSDKWQEALSTILAARYPIRS